MTSGGGSSTARKQLKLLIARGELAEARAERMMRSCAAEAAEVRLAGGDQLMLDRHAWRTSTLLDAERMLQRVLPAEVDLGEVFEGYATRFLIGSDVMTELRTSTACVLVSGEVCRWLMLVAAELLHAIESAADPNFGCKASVSIDHREDGLVMRIVSLGAYGRPVPRESGAAALARTGRLMKLFGRFDKIVQGADVTYEATFLGGRVCAAS